MNEYALFINGEFLEIRLSSTKPDDIPHKNITWYNVVREYGVPFTGIENGNYVIRTVDPSTVVTVPESVSPRQVRLLLLQQNLLANVESMIATQDEATKITWNYALEFRRNDPLLNELALELNLSQEDLDNFFIQASQL